MAFKPPPKQPEFASLIGALAQSKLKKNDEAAYQTVKLIIERIRQFQKITTDDVSDILSVLKGATFLTEVDERFRLPNSRRLVAGTNITFDVTLPGQLIINATGSGSNYYDSPLSDGDLIQAELIFGNGDPIICQVPNVP